MLSCKNMPEHRNSNSKITIKLTGEQQAAVAQAMQISKISATGLARLALEALCRHIERRVKLTAPIEIISAKELEGFRQTFIVPLRDDAPFSVGTKTRRIDPVTAALVT